MSSNYNTTNSQEIDLRFLWQKFLAMLDSLGLLFFRLVRFLIKNVYIVISLAVIGLVLGYLLDRKNNTTYKHQVILALNFDSSSFLYSKIKNIKESEFPDVKSVHIEPIINVYEFISDKWDNLKIAEFLGENNIRIHKHKEGDQVEKIYKYHTLTLTSEKKDIEGSVIDKFLDDINKEPYFVNRKNIENENIKTQIREYEQSIQDLNNIFKNLGDSSRIESSGIKIETQSQTNDLLDNKQNLINKVNKLKVLQLEQQKVFYDLTRITNIKVDSNLYTLMLPLVFIAFFIAFAILKKLYRRYS